jgi:two-component system, OmpR family, sensor histidine kinase ChvG
MASVPVSQRIFFSLSTRILAVNLLAMVMLAGGILYLDTFRSKLIEQRRAQMIQQTELVAASLAQAPQRLQPFLLDRLAVANNMPRMQLFDDRLALFADTRAPQGEMLVSRPLIHEGRIDWLGARQRSARALDLVLEWLAGTPELEPFRVAGSLNSRGFSELRAVQTGKVSSVLRRREDGVIVISVAAPIPGFEQKNSVYLTADTRDLVRLVRRERMSSFQLFCLTLALTLLLSIFLSRTIARPLKRLAVAAERVRLGRGRDVAVPRFLGRRDEIGELSRALSDMTQSLHSRMDATESFAADVSHELKNPLASMRGAVDVLQKTKDPNLQARLFSVLQHDMQRMQRLITDISDASRLDAELSRNHLERVDLAAMLRTLVEMYSASHAQLKFVMKFKQHSMLVPGIELRVGQVLRNILDNAVSFSPPGGQISLGLTRSHGLAHITIEDEGPGIPADNVEDIFKRFYSERPEAEDFGQHSGLGLAISKQIVEAHGGTLRAENITPHGARFILTLALA